MTLLALVDLWLALYCAEILPLGRYDVVRQTCEVEMWHNP